jgi:branched-chain amino acid transport system substrate-binding protein
MKLSLRQAQLAVAALACVAAHTSPSWADNAKPTIGVIIPLSGPLAEYGDAIRNGIALAESDTAKDRRGCRFKIADSRYSPPLALTAFRSLTTNDNAKLVYVFGGPPGEALAPVAEQAKVPLLSDSIDPVISEGRQFVFRYANPSDDYGRVLAEYLQKRGIKSLGVFKVDNQYVQAMFNGFTAQKHRPEVQVLASINPEESDVRSLVPRLSTAQVDAVGVFLMSGQVSSFLRHAKGSLKERLIVGTDFFESSVEIQAAGGALEGAVYTNNLVGDEFRKRYISKFRTSSQIKFAAEGYDVAKMVLDEICRLPRETTASEIVSRLEQVPPRNGALGRTEFHRSQLGDKYFAAPVVVMTVRGTSVAPLE